MYLRNTVIIVKMHSKNSTCPPSSSSFLFLLLPPSIHQRQVPSTVNPPRVGCLSRYKDVCWSLDSADDLFDVLDDLDFFDSFLLSLPLQLAMQVLIASVM